MQNNMLLSLYYILLNGFGGVITITAVQAVDLYIIYGMK